MAKKQIVWGIDIGNSSLKAMRCCAADEPGKIEVLSCDFIEHSKVLSQPDTDAAEVFSETLQTFFGRNQVKGDRIAIAVSGQNTISRFLKLPPVDPKKIPDVIKYEAKQWLPFALNEVVWDFQPLGVDANEPTDLLMDATVGMFAIKKDLAMKTLSPYASRSINVDVIQSSPMALYNYVAYDQINELEPASEFDSEESELVVTICIGTDASDVVITNGSSIWTRNIPIGGGSFTKMLAKNLQLTYSKAEYVKRNIGTAPDQQSVVQAMRAAFNDTVNEVNRSLEYYQTLNRKAQFKKILVTGNAGKLLGLRQYLAQNLGYEIERITKYQRLVGADVLNSAEFKDNLPSFAICYGLAVQQLGLASLKTNLIPREIVTDRIIREKKPWVLAASAAVLLGMTLHFASATSVLQRVNNSNYDESGKKVTTLEATDKKFKDEMQTAVAEFDSVDSIGKTLTSSVEGRITWLELLRTINEALPKEESDKAGETDKITSESVAAENKVYITSIDALPVSSLASWFAPLKKAMRYVPDEQEYEELRAANSSGGTAEAGAKAATAGVAPPAAVPAAKKTKTPLQLKPGAKAAVPADDAAAENADDAAAPVNFQPYDVMEEDRLAAIVPGPEDVTGGNMRVVQITGFHYHNPPKKAGRVDAKLAAKDTDVKASDGEAVYLRKTLLYNLKHGTVVLPSSGEAITMKELGVSYPVLIDTPEAEPVSIIHPVLQPLVDAGAVTDTGGGSRGSRGERGYDSDDRDYRANSKQGKAAETLADHAKKLGVPERLSLRRFDFVIQFAWVETPPSVRDKKKENDGKKAEANVAGADTEEKK